MHLQMTDRAVSSCQEVVYVLVHGCIIGDHTNQVDELFNCIEFVPIDADHWWVVVGMWRFLVHHLSLFRLMVKPKSLRKAVKTVLEYFLCVGQKSAVIYKEQF